MLRGGLADHVRRRTAAAGPAALVVIFAAQRHVKAGLAAGTGR